MARKSELGRQIAVDLESDADFDKGRCRPGHGVSFRPLFHWRRFSNTSAMARRCQRGNGHRPAIRALDARASSRCHAPALSWGFCQDHHHEEVLWAKLAKTCSGTSRPADGCYRLKPAARPEIPAKSGILGPVQNSHSRRLFYSVLLGKA